MINKDEEISDIHTEISLIRQDFSVRLHKLEQRLHTLENKQLATSDLSVSKSSVVVNTQIQVSKDELQSSEVQLKQIKQRPLFIDQNPKSNTDTNDKTSRLNITALLEENVFPLLSPFVHVLAPLFKFYQHYQNKGQGPIFLFMLVGTALLVGGFGYLAQLLVGELGAGSKTLLLFVVSISVTVGGHFLAKRPSYTELGSATISLGLLLNFVTIYIAGSYYHLLADGLILLAYFAVGLSGFILSYRHSAQIVSALAILGGGIIPLISHLDSIGTSYYLLGLSFLAAGSVFQATTKIWNWLNFMTVIIVSACLEYLLLFSDTQQIVGIFSQFFYCLYTWVIWQFLRKKLAMTKEHLLFISLSLFASIGLLMQSELTPYWLIPLISLVNSAFWLVLLIKSQYFSHIGKSVCGMISSVWLLVAICNSLAADYWGLAVGLEGLFILYFALKENYPRLRIEAYSLIAFAILHGIVTIQPYFPTPALLNVKGMLILASIGALLFIPRRFLANCMQLQSVQLPILEVLLERKLRQVESAWLVFTVVACAWVYLHQWSIIALIPMQLMLLWKSYRRNCNFSEALVFAITFAIAGSVIVIALQIHSFSFRDLPAFAQVSSIILFIELWALCEYYRRGQQSGMLADLAESMRLIAYLAAPLLFLPSVYKHYHELLTLALWLSASLAYGLGRLIKHHLIRTESLALSLVAAVYVISDLLFTQSLYSLPNMLGALVGALYFAYFFFRVNQRYIPLLEKKLASIGLYFYGGMLFISILRLSNVYLAGTVISLYFFVLFILRDLHPTLMRNISNLQRLSYLFIPLSWLAVLVVSQTDLISASIWVIFNILVIFTQLLLNKKWPLLSFILIKNNKRSYPMHHLLLAVGALLLLYAWELSLFIAPWLILQGSYLFFAQKQNHMMSKFALAYVFFGLIEIRFD